VEREAATEELKAAMEAAKESRAFEGLAKPIKRAKKAVEVEPSLLEEADKLKLELEEEKRENERLARLEAERVEREAATEELTAAIAAAKESRDASGLSKPIKRAKKAVEVAKELIAEGDTLKSAIDEEKKQQAKEEKEAKAAEAAAAKEQAAAAVAAAKRDAAAEATPPPPNPTMVTESEEADAAE